VTLVTTVLRDTTGIRVIVWVEAGERRRFERVLRRRLKEALGVFVRDQTVAT
jgi:hypothetical protein